jgi:hypothetical protein
MNHVSTKSSLPSRYSILHYKPGKMVFTGEWRI